jgi:hypothetical protein
MSSERLAITEEERERYVAVDTKSLVACSSSAPSGGSSSARVCSREVANSAASRTNAKHDFARAMGFGGREREGLGDEGEGCSGERPRR